MENIKKKVESLKEKAKHFSILYVEDEASLREKATLFLSKIFDHIDTAVDGVEGLDKFLNHTYDIIITDIIMPKMSGLELIQNIRVHNEKQEIIVLSADTSSEILSKCIQLGVTGYLIKPIDFFQVVTMLDISIDKLSAFRENEMYKSQLESMVDERTKKVLLLQNQLISNYEQAIRSLVKMIEGRDTYTGGHSERVANYSKLIAKSMGFDESACDLIYQAGILHDIGKITTPDAILLKPGKLSDDEYSLIKNHVTAGYEILSEVPMYNNFVEIIYAHHEHYDGSGYPRSLKGDEIPIEARIMGVADAFDAMTTGRIYKTRKSSEEAINELQELSGIWYDPNVMKYALDVLKLVNIDKNVSQEPNSELDDERFAYFYKDPLTHLHNHDYLDLVLKKSKNEDKKLCLNMIMLKKFTSYNRQYGWSEGDIVLSKFAIYLMSEFPNFQIFRVFGDDFALINITHQMIDIDKINNTELLRTSGLHCEHNHFDLPNENINSYKDLQKYTI
ncbi:HD domain-containing phosphohydrolase [Sulfuricurvum sp.]|uniref:HD domain-containing phosphohydrolase n=1 Tax=Sulfuricurvum sp. TaxID=2025608 RepID=UPI0025D3E22E|nr:HD domain-containing phosphohydrolase [Sulfuricurvum sp.]